MEAHFRASKGQNGMGKGRHGESGEDRYVRVAPGTLVRDEQTGGLLGELVDHGETLRVARGGRGGRGNAAFKTARDTTPKLTENGEPGAARWLSLELKLVADIGLVGCPNAGKSTLLAATTRAAPKIADYPFTTVTPNLGVWPPGDTSAANAAGARADDGGSVGGGDSGGGRDSVGNGGGTLVIADIPGLLEGAHDGIGLGRAFLRHIERCRLLVHVVDGSAADPVGDYEAVVTELRLFSPWLADKPSVVALNKRDMPEVREGEDQLLDALRKACGHQRVLAISAATRENCELLMRRLGKLLPEAKQRIPPAGTEEETIVIDKETGEGEGECAVHSEGVGAWRLTGHRIEKAAAMTNWDYAEAQGRFQRIMAALGASERLKKAGATTGDTIMVGNVDFAYFEESPMAARARLAGYGDEREVVAAATAAELTNEELGGEEVATDALARELDAELAELLDGEGDVITF